MLPLSVFLTALLVLTFSSFSSAATQPFGVQRLSGLGSINDVAIDNAGFLYAAGIINDVDGVLKLTPNGTVVQFFNASAPPGKVRWPWGVAVDSAANVYVSSHIGAWSGNPGTAVVVKYSPAGQPLLNYSLVPYSTNAIQVSPGLAQDSDGALYVTLDYAVEKFNSAGVGVQQFGGGLSSPTAVAVEHGTNAVYVLNMGNSRIVKFASNGNVIATALYAHGSYSCFGIAIDPRDGTIVVGCQPVQRFTTDLKFIANYTLPAPANTDITLGVAVSQTGVVYMPLLSGNILALHFEQCPAGYSCAAGVDSAVLCPVGSYCPTNQTAYGAQVMPCPSSACCESAGLTQPPSCSGSSASSSTGSDSPSTSAATASTEHSLVQLFIVVSGILLAHLLAG